MSMFAPLRSVLRTRVAGLAARTIVPRVAANQLPVRALSTSIPRFAKLPEQPRIRLGSEAPNFKATTTHGEIDFHEFIGDSWAILFSHPADFTPVCTTELGAFAKLVPEFRKRNVKLLGLSADKIDSHAEWAKDIDEIMGSQMASSTSQNTFPIIADPSREISFLYDMVDEAQVKEYEANGTPAFTVRSVFIIDPKKKVRLIMTYPASTGRNTAEVLRVVDSLQTADREGIATGVDWVKGDDVIVPPSVSTEAAKQKFGADKVKELKPYLRYATVKQN